MRSDSLFFPVGSYLKPISMIEIPRCLHLLCKTELNCTEGMHTFSCKMWFRLWLLNRHCISMFYKRIFQWPCVLFKITLFIADSPELEQLAAGDVIFLLFGAIAIITCKLTIVCWFPIRVCFLIHGHLFSRWHRESFFTVVGYLQVILIRLPE